MDVYAILKLKRRPSHQPLPTDTHGHHHHPLPPPVTARNRTTDTAMTDNVRAILPPAGAALVEGGDGGNGEGEEPSLTTALNATFRFALPDECLPARGLEAVEWLAKGPPRVRRIELSLCFFGFVCLCLTFAALLCVGPVCFFGSFSSVATSSQPPTT